MATRSRSSPRAAENAYRHFCTWYSKEGIEDDFSEETFIKYVRALSDSDYRIPSVQNHYALVRDQILLNNEIDISKYSKLRALIARLPTSTEDDDVDEDDDDDNRKSVQSYQINYKSPVFTRRELAKFLRKAPDEQYLITKVVLILGITGACSCEDLLKLTTGDVLDLGGSIDVRINDMHGKSRTFTVGKESHVGILQKYWSMRPDESLRYLVRYANGECLPTPLGVAKISNTTRDAAKFLQLRNAEQFNGHVLKRTGAMFKRFYKNYNDDNESDFYHSSDDDSNTQGPKRKKIKFEASDSSDAISDLPSVAPLEAVDVNDSLLVKLEHVEDYDDEDEDDVDESLVEDGATSSNSLLDLQKGLKVHSLELYESHYTKYCHWRVDKHRTVFTTEGVLLDYFTYLSEKGLQASSLMLHYSTLKRLIRERELINIDKYDKLLLFLHHFKGSVHSNYKKGKLFTKEEIVRFQNEAPDDSEHLTMKVVISFAAFGDLRRPALTYLKASDIEDKETSLVINTNNVRAKTPLKTPHVTEITDANTIDIYRKFVDEMPLVRPDDRLFTRFDDDSQKPQVIGIDVIGKYPLKIARFLKLPHPEDYNVNSFRRVDGKEKENSEEDDEDGESTTAPSSNLTKAAFNAHAHGISLNNCSECAINVYIKKKTV